MAIPLGIAPFYSFDGKCKNWDKIVKRGTENGR
ncbi:uncharacterized protein G2W53_026129 [Senna tora]|uniref:Uncharacterized protein n=1 Tax=Senna tora TaxID=362788 RepID=A0A834TGQ6_9FABA|nr:uncharacterized protein G2W53_026129 [Senna tora]